MDYLGANGSVLSFNLFAYCENNPIIGKDPDGKFSIPRMIISVGIDAIIWSLFSPGAAGWAALTQPVKAMARIWGQSLVKAKIRGILTGFTKTLVQAVIKVSTKLIPVLKKAVGWLFRRWADNLTANRLAATILGAIGSATSNAFLNAIASNVGIILSFGGLVAGLWDYFSDKKMDGWIKLW